MQWLMFTVVGLLVIGAVGFFSREDLSAEEEALALVGQGEAMVVQIHNPG